MQAHDAVARYGLSAQGVIGHWLACGPEITRIADLERFVPGAGSPFGTGRRWILNYWAYEPDSLRLKKRIFEGSSPFTWVPGDSPAHGRRAVGEQVWRYVATEEDGALDFSHFNFTPNLMRAWAYCELEVNEAVELAAEVQAIGPFQIWLNGALAHQYDQAFSYVEALRIPAMLSLKARRNSLYLHGLTFGWREARLALGLRFPAAPDLTVGIPLGDADADQWTRAEQDLAQVHLKQYAFPDLPATVQLDARAPQPVELDAEIDIPLAGSPWAKFGFLELPSGRARLTLEPGQSAELPLSPEIVRAFSRLPGENSLSLHLRPAGGGSLARHAEILAHDCAFSTAPYGDYDSRRAEARGHLAQMSYDVLAAMAAVETGLRPQIDSNAVTIALEFMSNRYDCADFYALSLLALLYRYGATAALLPEDEARITQAFLGFKFWIDEPGLDAMCYFTENHQILFQVSAYLAGQRWPDAQFKNSGLSGQQQQRRAYPRIRSWIERRLRGGYSEWDSNAYLALDIYAMLALVEFAASQSLREMARTLVDKTLFMIAMQSFRGTHGSTHGRCYVQGLKSGRMENTSSIQRIAWGMGIFNGETRATGMLALARNYRVPDVIQRIGADVDQIVTTWARSSAAFRPQFDMRGDRWDVRTITRRAPDVMLSAAVDHRPGERGVQEHLWQATLGPEAVVFSTYPGNSQEHGHARPNFWSGSARLPRVGLHERTVICLYRLEAGVGLPFSHAYFPTAVFDEWQIDGDWAFARKGGGYVALWGDGALILTESGKHVGQELRSSGGGDAWLCHVGSAAEDDNFAAFMRRVKAHAPILNDLTLTWTTPAGQALRFGWTGPFTVDGTPLDWDSFPLYRNVYTDTPMDAEMMTLTHEGEALALPLKRGAR